MCFFGVQQGSTDNKDCYCLDRRFGFLPVTSLSLVLNADPEVKVAGDTTSRRRSLRTRVDTKQQFNFLINGKSNH